MNKNKNGEIRGADDRSRGQEHDQHAKSSEDPAIFSELQITEVNRSQLARHFGDDISNDDMRFDDSGDEDVDMNGFDSQLCLTFVCFIYTQT